MHKIFIILILGGGLLANSSIAIAGEPEAPMAGMTILKEWQPDSSVNGEFERARRNWLATLRNNRNKDMALSNNIRVETIIDNSVVENEDVSKELLESFVNKIKKEIREP